MRNIMSEIIGHDGSDGSSLRQRRVGEEEEMTVASCNRTPLSIDTGMMELEPVELATTPRFPPLTMVIRKTSIVGCLLVVLGGLLWCIMQTVHSIQEWQSPSGKDMDPLCWPVVKAYLLLVAYLTLFVTVTLFAFMIPSLVMTWIVAIVLTYLSSIGIGRERHQRKVLVKTASGWAKDMSWSTLKSAMQEGKVFGVALALTLLMLPWVLGKSSIFAGQACH